MPVRGPLRGPVRGPARGPYRGGVSVPTDGPSNYRFPSTAGHFTALGLAVPANLYGCQDASGSLVDSIGGQNAGLIGTGMSYQQAVAGYSRLAVASTDAANGRFTNAVSPDPATTSCLMAVYCAVTALPAATRTIHGFGVAVPGANQVLTTGVMRTRLVNTQDGTVDRTGPVRLWLLQYDRAAGVTRGANDQELRTPAYAATASGQTTGIGGVAGAVCPAAQWLWWAQWFGADAELTLAGFRNVHNQLTGGSVPW